MRCGCCPRAILDRVGNFGPLRWIRTSDVTVEGILHVGPRERQLLRRFASGKTDRQIAAELGSTPSSIAVHSRFTSRVDDDSFDPFREEHEQKSRGLPHLSVS